MLKVKSPQLHSSAFTVVEVAIIVPIVLIAIGIFTLTIINLTEKATYSRNDNFLATEVQGVLNRMASDIGGAQKFLSQNELTVQAPQGLNNDTTKFTNQSPIYQNKNILILKMPFTKANPRNASTSSDNFIYVPNVPLTCSDTNVAENAIATHEVVYFIKFDSVSPGHYSLYRRTLVPKDYSDSNNACSTPWQKPTCTEGYSGEYCAGGKDEKILGGGPHNYSFEVFNIIYMNRDTPIAKIDSNAPISPEVRQEVLNKATSIKINITVRYIDSLPYRAERILPLD